MLGPFHCCSSLSYSPTSSPDHSTTLSSGSSDSSQVATYRRGVAGILRRMEYQVPQFIEVEDKIVGPLTLKQFIYIAGAVGLCVVFFAYLPIIFAFILAAPVVGLAVALAFYKVNGKSFIEILEAGFNYYIGAKLFLWKHKDQSVKEQSATATAA